MSESFVEIVQFDWLTNGANGPDAATRDMTESLDNIEARINSVARTAQEAFGSFPQYLQPAIGSTAALSMNLQHIIEQLAAIKGMGPIDPFRDMGQPPAPRPSSPPQSGDIVQLGGFRYNSNLDEVRVAAGYPGAGRFADRDAFATALRAPNQGSLTSYSGDISTPGMPNYMGGGVGSEYNKPRLTNLGFFGENNPRYESISYGDQAKSGMSSEENDWLNSQIGSSGQPLPMWLRKLLAPDGRLPYNTPTLNNFGTGGGISTWERGGDRWQNGFPALDPGMLNAASGGTSSYTKPMLGQGAMTSARLSDDEANNLVDIIKSIGRGGAGLINEYNKPVLSRGGLTSQPLSDEQLTKITQAFSEFANRPAPFSNWQGPLGSLPETRSINVPDAAVNLNALADINSRSVNILQDLSGRMGTPFSQWQGSSGMELASRPNMGWQANFYNPQLPNMTMGNGFNMYPPGFNPGPMSATPFSYPLLGAPGAGGGGAGIPPWWMGGGGAGGAGGGSYSGFSGPFFDQRIAQMAQSSIQNRADQEFKYGNFAGFEKIMQNEGIPASMAGNQANARVGEQYSDANFARFPAPGPGTGKFYDQAYYGQKIGNLNSDMTTAMSESTVDPAKVQKIQEDINAAKKAQDGLNDSTDQFGDMLGRIATRIAIYTAIYGAIQLVSSAVKEFAANLLELNDVSARTSFINGQSQNDVQGQFAQAAKYGVAPQQAGAGILTGAQLNTSPEQQKQAGQLAEIFGTGEYSNALLGLNRIQAQVNATGLQHVEVMDFIAQSYKTMPGTLGDYFGALQHGIDLNAQFGVSAEAMGLAIEKASTGTGQSVDNISVIFQSILSKIGTPATQKALQQEGIGAGSPQEVVAQINAKYQDLLAAGDRAGIQKFGESIQGGGIGGYSRTENLPVVFAAINDALNGGNANLAKFDDLLTRVSGTGVTKINQMTAAWQSFLLALGNTGPIQAVFDFITTGLTSDTAILNSLGKIIPGLINNAGSIAISNPLNDAKRLSNYEELNPVKNEFDFGLNPAAFGAYLAEYIAKVIDYMNSKPGISVERPGPSSIGVSSGGGLRVPQSILNPYPTPIDNFGGLQELPQGVTLPNYEKMVQAQETKLKIAGVPTDDKNYEVLSKSGDLLGMMLADTNAIRLTNQQIASGVSSFGGFAPAGLTSATAGDFQARVTAEDQKLKAAGITISDPKTEVFQDKVTGELIAIRGSNEGIQVATQFIASSTPQFSGILPKGMDVNKIQARVDELNPQVLAAGIAPDPITKVFYDETTKTWKTITGQNAAIQIATEESAKLLQQQITGAFNVPTGGEAVVAFFALQQGFQPSYLQNGASGGSNLNGSATALTGSAGQLNAAAQALKAAGASMGLDAGNKGILDWLIQQKNNNENGASPSVIGAGAHPGGAPGSFHTPATSNYYPPGSHATDPLGYPGEFHTPQTSNMPGPNGNKYNTHPTQGAPYDTNPYSRKLLPIAPAPQLNTASAGGINVTNQIRVNIDGRQIAYYQNRKTYRQFESVRNSVTGVPNSVVTI